MKNKVLQWCGYICVTLVLLTNGCANREQGGDLASVKEPADQSMATSYKGKITAISKRAKTVFMTIGSGHAAQTVRVKFDDATKGIDEVAEGQFATIDYERRGDEAFATNIQRTKTTLPEGVTDIGTDELRRLLKEQGSFVLVDPRPGDRYQQSHLPGAVSIPYDLPAQQQDALLPKNKDALLVFYDGGHGRGTAVNAAAAAKSKGFANVRVYTAGRAAWMEAALPTYSSKGFIQKGNALLVDTRPSQTSVAGRIKGAYNVSVDKLKTALRDLPLDAPIVLYGDQEVQAFELLSDEGFTAVTLVDGGYRGWVEAGGEIQKGPITAAKINWKRNLEPGEISLADFRKAVTGEKRDVLIIDVRGQDEIGNQKLIANAINIPLDELPAREATLPKEKAIYLYCATGARAKMAYSELASVGFNAKFLRMNLKDLVQAL